MFEESSTCDHWNSLCGTTLNIHPSSPELANISVCVHAPWGELAFTLNCSTQSFPQSLENRSYCHSHLQVGLTKFPWLTQDDAHYPSDQEEETSRRD